MTHALLVGRWPTDTDKLAAVARLGLLKDSTPSLVAAEADARTTLAAAIMMMEAQQAAGDPAVFEQAIVESALVAYGNALADRLRGTTSEEP